MEATSTPRHRIVGSGAVAFGSAEGGAVELPDAAGVALDFAETAEVRSAAAVTKPLVAALATDVAGTTNPLTRLPVVGVFVGRNDGEGRMSPPPTPPALPLANASRICSTFDIVTGGFAATDGGSFNAIDPMSLVVGERVITAGPR